MKRLTNRIKSKHGLAHFLHLGFTVLLPVLLFVMIRINLSVVALVLVLVSKWRMFAVKPRHWPANVRANAIDILVGVAAVIFMSHSDTQMWQLIWAFLYGAWLLIIKPSSGVVAVSLQALIGQFAGLTALFLSFGEAPTAVLVISAWTIAYVSARHFLTSFDEPMSRLFANVWAYFAAALLWLLSHWLLFYGAIAQPTLLLTVIGFSLATLYYLDETDRLSQFFQRQIIFVMMAVIVIVLVFSDWGDKTI